MKNSELLKPSEPRRWRLVINCAGEKIALCGDQRSMRAAFDNLASALECGVSCCVVEGEGDDATRDLQKFLVRVEEVRFFGIGVI